MIYEISITHLEGPCPTLPSSPTSDVSYLEPPAYTSTTCPSHFVFKEECDIATARLHKTVETSARNCCYSVIWERG